MEEKSNNKNIGWCSSYVTIPQSLITVHKYSTVPVQCTVYNASLPLFPVDGVLAAVEAHQVIVEYPCECVEDRGLVSLV